MKIMKKHSERLKVQNILDKIKEDSFSSEDIDLLLIKLREYAKPKSLFEEICHFAAHNESRNKGVSFDYLSSFFNVILFHFNHSFDGGEPLDFDKPIPAYVINTILFNLRLSSADFQQKYKCSPTQFESRFNNTFQKINGTNTYKLKGTVKESVATVIYDMLSCIVIRPLCDGGKILNELFLLLQDNDFHITFDEINLRSEKIILFIIYLMHNTEYQISGSIKGFSQIHTSPEQNSTIQLVAIVPNEKKGIHFIFPLITTNISSYLFCSDSILRNCANDSSQLIIKLDDAAQLIINKQGKLDILPSS